MEVLKLENVSKFYTSKTSVVMGLSSVNLSFKVGEFVAITGESGSGKSTLAHVLGGIIPYESGEMHIYGEPTSHYDASDWERYRRDLISFISQSYGVLVGNTVLENVETALRFGGMDKEQTRERALEILKEVDLYEFRFRKAGKLSSGQKQRLSIARALAKPSKILIADEPTGNLDAENSDKVIKLLHKASKDRLVIIITHEFSEVENYVTRRIILSDACVVTDAPLTPVAKHEDSVSDVKSVGEIGKRAKAKWVLAPYVTYLTVKSRPVFSAIVCLLLAVTTLITFVFLGTFAVTLDDTSTKIYDDTAFPNGDPSRLLVLKEDNTPFTDGELEDILDIRYVQKVDRWGGITDTNYYYREGIDFRIYQETVPKKNNYSAGDEYVTINVVDFLSSALYMSTVPVTDKDIVEEGSLPKGMYEVLSADPAHKVGDKVTVHIRNRNNWTVDKKSQYITVIFDVVGTTEYGSGLYFSDEMASFIDDASYVPTETEAIFLPYQNGNFDIAYPIIGMESLAPTEVLIPGDISHNSKGIGNNKFFFLDEVTLPLTARGIFTCNFVKLFLVHEEIYKEITDHGPSTQTAVYIKDYAYTDRVIDELQSMGYLTASPYRLGAVTENEELSSERDVTMYVCLAAFALTVILQFILMKAMFNSITTHYKLMSNIGLTSRIAYGSVSLMLLIYTLIGELSGLGVVLILNAIRFNYVVAIFKYVDISTMALLILAHFALCALSLFSVYKSLKKQVFESEKTDEDIDLSSVEEVKAND